MKLVEQLQHYLSELLPLFVLFLLIAFLIKRQDAATHWQAVIQSSLFNLSCILINLILMLPLLNIIHESFMTFIPGLLTKVWDNTNSIVVVVFAVFAGDFIGYWRHRFEHSRLLWPAHATHHSDEHMTWLTLQRFHPINFLSTFVIDTTFLTLLGFPPYAVIANNLIRHYYGYFIHADIPWRYGLLEKVFVTPTMHRWHHAKERAAHNTNYATVFSVLDRAFGTYRVPSQCTVPLGVSHKLGKNILPQMLYPFRPSAYRRPTKSASQLTQNDEIEHAYPRE